MIPGYSPACCPGYAPMSPRIIPRVAEACSHGGDRLGDFDEGSERRRRPQMSLGGMAAAGTLLIMLIGSVRYFDNIEMKLNALTEQSAVVPTVKAQLSMHEWVLRNAGLWPR